MTSMHSIEWYTVLSKLKRIKTGVSQVEFYLQHYSTFTSLTFTPPKNVKIRKYANDITITAFHTKYCKAQQLIQPYLDKIYEWATNNSLYINMNKTTITLTPDPSEYGITLSLKLNNQTLPTTKHPKFLESL